MNVTAAYAHLGAALDTCDYSGIEHDFHLGLLQNPNKEGMDEPPDHEQQHDG